MAVLKGDVGKIMFENAGGTEADIAATRSWSLSVTKILTKQQNKAIPQNHLLVV